VILCLRYFLEGGFQMGVGPEGEFSTANCGIIGQIRYYVIIPNTHDD
jgi:hypothetical protein